MENTATITLARLKELEKYEELIESKTNTIYRRDWGYGRSCSTYAYIKQSEDEFLENLIEAYEKKVKSYEEDVDRLRKNANEFREKIAELNSEISNNQFNKQEKKRFRLWN